ncbi:MAG: hypothetical protein NZ853_06140 [Leptospiraceae bacterium]|nr:hypothetical protein [Leptospiraceae bacterium]MDW7976469.1 hypothetical protein [Leptospiraceae bacterium]
MGKKEFYYIIKLVDEILNSNNEEKLKEIKKQINQLSAKELWELMDIYQAIHRMINSDERLPLPDFYAYQVKEFYQKQLQRQEEKAKNRISLKLLENSIEILSSSLSLPVELIPIPNYRANGLGKSYKVVLRDNQNESLVEYSFIPQQSEVLLSIYFYHVYGALTIKLYRDEEIISQKQISITKEKERINLDNLSKGNYSLEILSTYHQVLHFDIQ